MAFESNAQRLLDLFLGVMKSGHRSIVKIYAGLFESVAGCL
jgi:hypothetical protein